VIGRALNAARKLPNYHFNRTETDRFFAVIATGKKCKIVPDDSKNAYDINKLLNLLLNKFNRKFFKI